MSLPFTHVWAALLALKQLPAILGPQRDEFILGTLYPDSRYLTGVPRTQTHPAKSASLHDVAAWSNNAFQAGAVLHTFVDRIRLHYLRQSQRALVMARHANLPHADTAWKVVEDSSAWALIPPQDLERVLARLRRGQGDGIDGRIGKLSAQWYGILLNYLSARPTDATRLQLALSLKQPKSEGESLIRSARTLGRDKEVVEAIIDFFIELPTLLQVDLSPASVSS